MSVVQLSHDPFARESLYRERVRSDRELCVWCGASARFRYAIVPDYSNNRNVFNGKAFCSIGCYRTYTI